MECKHHLTFISASGYYNTETTLQKAPPSTWEEYLTTLPNWDKELVSDVRLFKIHSLLALLHNNSDIFISSDRGAKDNIGSFGSVLASNKEILIEIMGQAYGKKPRSFRAEAYGTLAILRFLYHIIHFYKIETLTNKKIYSNNKGLIHRVTEIKKYTTICPRRSTLSESDIELQIYDTLCIINTT